ncbi:MAG: site-2 protease family protein [Dongiaceae bacterium]
MDGDFWTMAGTVAAWGLALIIAVPMHEAAHGFVAWRLGDDTAYRLGRVTANPLRHIDPLGTLILPGLMLLATGMRFTFGYAKPVPVNFARLNRPRRDMVLVAAAGPGINLILALVAALSMHLALLLPAEARLWTMEFLTISIYLNVLLAIFNLIPIPPLDGGRIAVGLLPAPLAYPLARLERLGIFVVIGGLFLLPLLLDQVGIGFNPAHWLIGRPVAAVIDLVLMIAGVR